MRDIMWISTLVILGDKPAGNKVSSKFKEIARITLVILVKVRIYIYQMSVFLC